MHAQWNLLQTKNTFSISLFFTRSTAYVHIFKVYKYTLLKVTPLNSGVVLRNILAVRQGYASRAPLTSFFTRNWPCISFLYLKQRKLEIILKNDHWTKRIFYHNCTYCNPVFVLIYENMKLIINVLINEDIIWAMYLQYTHDRYHRL